MTFADMSFSDLRAIYNDGFDDLDPEQQLALEQAISHAIDDRSSSGSVGGSSGFDFDLDFDFD